MYPDLTGGGGVTPPPLTHHRTTAHTTAHLTPCRLFQDLLSAYASLQMVFCRMKSQLLVHFQMHKN
jgi:hypothetical protein